MEAVKIAGTYKAITNPGFPRDIGSKRFTVQVEGDQVKLTQDDDTFILINQVLYIISTPLELMITNPKGTLNFQKCSDEDKASQKLS